MEACLISAQFVPSFALVLKSLVNDLQKVRRFEGEGGAFLHLFQGRKEASLKMLWVPLGHPQSKRLTCHYLVQID